MRTFLATFILLAGLAFAGETATPAPTKATQEVVIINPTKEQLAKAKPMNNTICPISHEKVGGMGGAVQVIYKGRIINLCCMGCPSDFAKNPEKYYQALLKETGTKEK